MYLVTKNVHIVTGSNSIIQSKYRSSRILDTAAQLITDLAPCFTVGTRHSGLEASLGEVQTKTQPDVGNVKDGSPDQIFTF
jgi:hypothetical protein